MKVSQISRLLLTIPSISPYIFSLFHYTARYGIVMWVNILGNRQCYSLGSPDVHKISILHFYSFKKILVELISVLGISVS